MKKNASLFALLGAVAFIASAAPAFAQSCDAKVRAKYPSGSLERSSRAALVAECERSGRVGTGTLYKGGNTGGTQTCAQRAQNCVNLGGGSACTAPARLAQCRATGTYVAPSGRTWPAKG